MRVVGIARLTRDPELRDANGTPVVNMRVAWNTKQRGADKAHFIGVTAFGRTAELCSEFLAKGRQALIDGRLELDEWTNQEGVTRSEHKVIVDRIEFIGGRQDAGSGSAPATDDDLPF